MIASTPPRDDAPSARKRDRPSDMARGPSSAPSFSSAATGDGSVPASLSLFQNNIRGHITCSPSPARGVIAPAAAAVSPFTDRLVTPFNPRAAGEAAFPSPLLRLEPVPEEGTDNDKNIFSQGSATSSVTFAPSPSAEQMYDGASCGGGEFWSDREEMLGATVGAVESVVGGSVGDDGPSSLSSGEYTNDNNAMVGFHQYPEQEECCPPTKRARLDPYEHRITHSLDEALPNADANMECDSPLKKPGGSHGMKLRTNIDKPRGLCCHVCSTEAQWVGEMVEERTLGHLSDVEPLAPRSRSLLSYFQPTAKKPQSLNTSKAREGIPSGTCRPPSNLVPCRYCDKPTCAPCARPCEQCHHPFCTFCTKVNYERSVERVLCFECDERLAGRGGSDEDCDMMDL